jgi:hypothetical protein
MENEQNQQNTKSENENKKSIPTRGIPSKDSMYLPAYDSSFIKTFQDNNEIQTKNIWKVEEILMFIFPKQYQERYYQIALSFIEFLAKKPRLEGKQISSFLKENSISKATFYNRVLPRLRRVGMIKIEREVGLDPTTNKKVKPMIISLSKTFGNYLTKIGDSWLSFVDEARSKK